MTDGDLVQLVAFRTRLPADQFTSAWRPIASGFLDAGLGTITLASFDDAEDGTAFLSRNTWPADAYRRAFPGGLAADGAAGPVSVRQAGVFAPLDGGGRPVAEARPDLELSLALVRVPDAHDRPAVVAAALAAVPGGDAVAYLGAASGQRYDVALTVHGARGTGASAAAALRSALAAFAGVDHSVVLSGRELLSLT